MKDEEVIELERKKLLEQLEKPQEILKDLKTILSEDDIPYFKELIEQKHKERQEKRELEERESKIKYLQTEINWDDTLEDFNEARLKTQAKCFNAPLFIIGSTKDIIIGRPQLNGNSKNKIILLRKITKIKKEKNGEEQFITSLKFMNERYDARYDGKEEESLAIDFWTYIVEGNDNKVYTLLSKEKLPNEVCEFKGMKMEMNDQIEVSKTLKINKLTDIFFVKSYESSVKTLPKEQLYSFVKEKKIDLQLWRDTLGWNEQNQNINRYPEETENLRSIIILSGKKDGYPLSTLLMGRAGTKKTAFIETFDCKINENPNICEGSITTLKGLTPSFVSKPANPGFLCSSNRLALIDELGKMVEKELNRHEQQTGNLLGDFNSLIEHRKRIVTSGNDNSTEIQMTAKPIFTTNPIGKKANIQQHIGIIDSTFLSRNIIWVQDKEESDFVMSDESIVSPKGGLRPYITNNLNTPYKIPFGGNLVERNTFLTIFDSCFAFTCEIDQEKVKEIVKQTLEIANEPMKSDVWKPRALHHVYLIIDGLCKQRCLFEEEDQSFKANDTDFSRALQLLVRMINSWDFCLK